MEIKILSDAAISTGQRPVKTAEEQEDNCGQVLLQT
jgi:hypothetical protein